MPGHEFGSAEILTALAAELAFRSVVLLLLTVAAARLAARSSAARRSLIWRVALTALLLLLPASLLLPTLEIPLAGSIEWPMVPESKIVSGTSLSAVSSDQPQGSPSGNGGQSVARGAGGSASPLAMIWLAGSLFVLARFAVGWMRAHRLFGRADAVSGRLIIKEAYEVAESLGVSRNFLLVESSETDVPGAWGVLRPTVILPHEARSWSRQRLRRVLIHELSHIRRRDPLHAILSEIAVGVFWWNPLCWYAASRAREESEYACDDAVLSFGSLPSEYAEDLLSVARGVGIRRVTAISGGRLRQRIDLLFDAHRRDEPGTGFTAMAIACGAILVWLAGTTVLTARPMSRTVIAEPDHPAVSELPVWEPQQLRWSHDGQAGGMFLEGALDMTSLLRRDAFIGEDGLFVSFQRDAAGELSSFAAFERKGRIQLWSDEARGDGVESLRSLVSWLAPDWRNQPDSFIGIVNRDPAIAAGEILDSSGSIIQGIPGKSRNPTTGVLQAGWYDRGERIGIFARGPMELDQKRQSITRIDPDGWLTAFAWDRKSRRLRLVIVVPDPAGKLSIRSYENGVENQDLTLLRQVVTGLPEVGSNATSFTWTG